MKEKVREIVANTTYEAVQHDLNFPCTWAVFPEGGESSICYCTDRNRAELVVEALNALRKLTDSGMILTSIRNGEQNDG